MAAEENNRVAILNNSVVSNILAINKHNESVFTTRNSWFDLKKIIIK